MYEEHFILETRSGFLSNSLEGFFSENRIVRLDIIESNKLIDLFVQLGHMDSQSSIRRVLLSTSLIALVFTITQGTLELILPDDTFHIPSRDFYVFGHGGMMFWFCSSLVFTVVRRNPQNDHYSRQIFKSHCTNEILPIFRYISSY